MRRLVVALVFVAVLGGVFVTLQRREAEEVRRERSEAKLIEFDQRRVDGLEVAIRGDVHRFEREDDGWWLVSPVRDRADGEAIEFLMTFVRRSVVLLRIDDPESPASYGLVPPVLELGFEGVEVPQVRIGAGSPDGLGVYARLGDAEEIVLVETSAGSPFTHPAIEPLREPSLTGLPRAAVESVRIERRGAGAVELTRREDGWWLDRGNGPRPALDGAVNRVLDVLDGSTITRFLDGADARDPSFGVETPTARFVLRSEDRERAVRIGAETPAGLRYVLREDRPPVLVVEGLHDPEAFAPADDALLDRKLTKLNRYKVREVDYRKGERELSLRRGEDGWSADGEPVTDAVAFGFLARLLDVPVRSWREQSAPASEAVAEARIVLDDGTDARIRFWADRTAASDAVAGAVAEVRMDPPDVPEL